MATSSSKAAPPGSPRAKASAKRSPAKTPPKAKARAAAAAARLTPSPKRKLGFGAPAVEEEAGSYSLAQPDGGLWASESWSATVDQIR